MKKLGYASFEQFVSDNQPFPTLPVYNKIWGIKQSRIDEQSIQEVKFQTFK